MYIPFVQSPIKIEWISVVEEDWTKGFTVINKIREIYID